MSQKHGRFTACALGSSSSKTTGEIPFHFADTLRAVSLYRPWEASFVCRTAPFIHRGSRSLHGL